MRIGLVTDSGGLNDGSLNAATNRGLTAAQKDLGIVPSVLESKSEADYVASLSSFATQGYDLVIGVGLLMAGPMAQVAGRFPNTRFALIDATPAGTNGFADMPNVANVLFQNNEAGYLVGIIAGETARRKIGPATRNAVCALTVVAGGPWSDVTKGFEDGVRASSPSTRVIVAALSDHFPRSAAEQETFAKRAYATGLDHIGQGCDILFAVALAASPSYIRAAQEQKKYALALFPTGSNVNDQSVVAGARPSGVVLAVALRAVDLAVTDIIRKVTTGSFKGGNNVYGVAQDAVKYGGTDVQLPNEVRMAVSDAFLEIKAGRVRPAGGVAPFGP